MPIILKFEGGKVDNPRDPGGRTNQGITQRVYNAYRKRKGLQQRDVYELLHEERDDIYRVSYWGPIQGDQLPLGVDLVIFDGAVNSGVVQSIKWAQRAVGVIDDGVLGPGTLHALFNAPDKKALILAILAKREAFLKSLKTFNTFGHGWLNRTAELRRIALSWAGTGVQVSVAATPPTPDGSAKAEPADVKKAPPKGMGDVATGVGVGAGGVAATVQTLQEQLTPFSMAGGWISKLVIGLAVVAAVLTIGGLAWRFYSQRKAAKLKEANPS